MYLWFFLNNITGECLIFLQFAKHIKGRGTRIPHGVARCPNKETHEGQGKENRSTRSDLSLLTKGEGSRRNLRLSILEYAHAKYTKDRKLLCIFSGRKAIIQYTIQNPPGEIFLILIAI